MKNSLIETSLMKSDGYKREDIKLSNRVTLSKVIIKNDKDGNIYQSGNYHILRFNYEYIFRDYNLLIKQMKLCFREVIPDAKKILVVGLGNKEVVCDSLGAKVVNKLLLLSEENDFDTENIINGIIPNVLGVTGIESYDIICGVVNQINPDIVVCVDTLSARNYDNLFNSIQISDTSITPGSGVKNSRRTLSKNSLGKPVIVIGIPMLISVNNLVNSFVNINEIDSRQDMWLSPKDVDFAVEEFSYIISRSINEYFYPEIKPSEIEKYVKGIF